MNNEDHHHGAQLTVTLKAQPKMRNAPILNTSTDIDHVDKLCATDLLAGGAAVGISSVA